MNTSYVPWAVGGLVVVVLAIAVGGFLLFPREKTEEIALYAGTITIGYTTWPGYIGLYLARDKGFFADEGLTVELKKYDGFAELSGAYKNGDVQGKANLTLDAIQEAYEGLDHKVVAVIDHSNGGDAIIAKPSIENFAEIKGKKVAFEHGTLEEFFIRYALEQYNLTVADIIPVNLNAEESALALQRGEVDVATTYEPFVSETLGKMRGSIIFSSKEAPGLITDVLTFRSDFIKENPETVQAIVRAYFKGIQFWQEHREEATALIGKELGVTPDEATEQVAGLTVLDLDDNRTAFTFATGLSSLYGNMRYTGEFVAKQRTDAAVRVDTDSLIERSFVRNLSK
jgi:NitT/TauT family transport system substrate-binding protein